MNTVLKKVSLGLIGTILLASQGLNIKDVKAEVGQASSTYYNEQLVMKKDLGESTLQKYLVSTQNKVLINKAVEQGTPIIDESLKAQGTIGVQYLSKTNKRLKVAIAKDGKVYYYDFIGDGAVQALPLQLGSGNYSVTLYENTTDKKYKALKQWTVNVDMKDENSVYTGISTIVNWGIAPKAVTKAIELTEGINNDEEKAKVIYNYIINNVTYDKEKAKNVTSTYNVNIDSIYDSNKGICGDFSVLYGGMLRSVGIPTKFVVGTANNVNGYHSWNEIYINGKWNIVDTSYDSQVSSIGESHTMYKSQENYFKEKEY